MIDSQWTAQPSDDQALARGQVLKDRYRIEACIAEGSSAFVFRALDAMSGEAVAIKVLRASLLTRRPLEQGNWIRRFEREVRVILSVQHPAVLRLIDWGALPARNPVEPDETLVFGPYDRVKPASDDTVIPYLVMPLLNGQTLAQRLSQGPLELGAAMQVLLPVLSGLDALHGAGVVHRDLKPANLFLLEREHGPEGMIFDFGVAKLIGKTEQTLSGREGRLGTPRYMSPEQIGGSEKLDARSDQYALAVVLVEALCGRSAYDAEGIAQLALAVSQAKVGGLDALPPLPDGFVFALERALRKRPAERYPNCLAFANALLACLPSSDADVLRARLAQFSTGP